MTEVLFSWGFQENGLLGENLKASFTTILLKIITITNLLILTISLSTYVQLKYNICNNWIKTGSYNAKCLGV